MQIQISAKGISLDDEQHAWIERRLQFALGRFVQRIRRVSLLLTDENGDRGGVDKHLKLRIAINPSGLILIEDVDDSIEKVVANVVDRASRSIARKIGRDHGSTAPLVVPQSSKALRP